MSLKGGAGMIEALLEMPAEGPRGIAVVCHPHPLHGGAMTNKVAYALANGARKRGLAALRFNFRGVGRSEGGHDEGRGETDDTVLVAQWLGEQFPGLPLLLAGFSFGAYVALAASVRARPSLLVTVAPPFRYFGEGDRPPHPGVPWLVVQARDDDVVAFEDTRRGVDNYDPPPELVALDQGGHFFHGHIVELQSICEGFIKRNLPSPH